MLSHVLVQVVRVAADSMYVPGVAAMNLQHVFCKPDMITAQQQQIYKPDYYSLLQVETMFALEMVS